jgi:hypothetical protein
MFDMWYLTQFPEGVTEYFSNSMGDWVSIDHQVEHQTRQVRRGLVWVRHRPGRRHLASQHLGLRSRGYRGAYLPLQERRIRYFHDNLDRYLDRGRAESHA